MRVNAGQELVIGGYTPSPKNFDALVIGYYDGDKLIYAARTRNGFTPASRAELFKKLKPLEIKECPFANLPEKKAGHSSLGYKTPEAFRKSFTPSPRSLDLPQILASVKATLRAPAAALTGAAVCEPESKSEAKEKNELNQNGIVV